MNFKDLAKTQRKLDCRVTKEKGLENQDLIDKRILGLTVEVGELCNEWQMFKFWKDNPEPNTREEVACGACKGSGVFEVMGARGVCAHCKGEGFKEVKNPLLEEYVDVLHFLLSIGNEVPGAYDFEMIVHSIDGDLTDLFLEFFKSITIFRGEQNNMNFEDMLSDWMGIGFLLGFEDETVEKAYFEKNKINHERQDNGY